MSDWNEQREQNKKLRNLALLWVVISLVIAMVAGAIVFSKLRPKETQVGEVQPQPTVQPQVAQVATNTPPVATPQVINEPTSEVVVETSQPEEATPEAVRDLVPINEFGYGIQVQGSVSHENVDTIGRVEELGMGWIKQQVRWGEIELSPGDLNWGMINKIIKKANQSNIRVMLSVVTAPAWSRAAGDTHGPPDDLNQYAAFLGKLIDQYPGKISAIEVWNEQNLEREWKSDGGLSAEKYVEMLRLAYQTIKAKDPNIVVISGALAPTGGWVEPDGRVTAIDDFTFFQQLLDAGLLETADCVGAHHNGYNIGPDVLAEDAPNSDQAAISTFRGPFDNVHHSWSFKSTLMGYSQMMAGQKKLCVTEFGWASSEGLGGTPAGFGFADDNTLQEQADWIVQAFQLQKEWGITWLAFLWNLDYGPKGLGPEDDNVPYSILSYPDGEPRPSFYALEAVAKP